jgi:phosphonate transport system substrate-binding protein
MGDCLRFATFLAPNVWPVYRCVAARVADRLGCRTELVVGETFADFAAGRADVGFICGLPYVDLMDLPEPPVELLAAPVLAGERYGGRPIYFSDVIVRRDSPVRCFAELRGRSWAYNDTASHSGYNLTRYQLLRRGETDGFFGRVVAAGFHQRAIRLVARGEIDGAAIDSQVLAIELRDNPALTEQLRVVERFGPSPIQPVVAACRLPTDLKTALRGVLLDLHDDPAAGEDLARGLVERFVPIADADYDAIRAMRDAAISVKYTELQ